MFFSRAVFLSAVTAVALSTAASSAGAQAQVCPGSETIVTPSNAAQARAAAICIVNNERAARSLPTLALNAPLAQSSQAHADDAAARRFTSLTAPDPAPHGKSSRDRSTKFGHPTSEALGERAFSAGPTPRSNLEAGFLDPYNCTPIIDPVYTKIGVGVGVFMPEGVPFFIITLGGTGAPSAQNAACPITPLLTPLDTPPVATPPAATPPPVIPTSTPTQAAQALAQQPPSQVAAALGMPSAKVCISRRSFDIRLREPAPIRLRSATVTLPGRKSVAKRVKGRLTARVNLRGFTKGTFTARITAKTTTGITLKGSRKYKTCGGRGNNKGSKL